MNRSRSSAAACVALSALLFASTSQALEAGACVRAADTAQRLKLDGHLLAAEEQLVTCADPRCPTVVRVACSEWVRDIQRSVPTLVLAAKLATEACGREGPRAETHDLVDVDVSLDGKLVTHRLDGRAIPLDPGPHVLWFELPGSPVAPHEETIQIREGEKLREVAVTLRAALEPCAAAPASAKPVAAYVAGGVALAGFGAFAFFAASSHAKYHDLMQTCAPSCSSDARAPLLVEQDLADVSLGVGIVAAAVATWLFVAAGATHVAVQPVGRGAALRVSF